jgi:hypothetical protein
MRNSRHPTPPQQVQTAVVAIGESPPDRPEDGQLWWDSVGGALYLRYNDGKSTQWIGLTPPLCPVPIRKRRRPGGGRKRFFTADEIVRLQNEYRRLLVENGDIKDGTAVTRLRSLVPEEKRGPDYLRNYQRHIFLPVRGKRRTSK